MGTAAIQTGQVTQDLAEIPRELINLDPLLRRSGFVVPFELSQFPMKPHREQGVLELDFQKANARAKYTKRHKTRCRPSVGLPMALRLLPVPVNASGKNRLQPFQDGSVGVRDIDYKTVVPTRRADSDAALTINESGNVGASRRCDAKADPFFAADDCELLPEACSTSPVQAVTACPIHAERRHGFSLTTSTAPFFARRRSLMRAVATGHVSGTPTRLAPRRQTVGTELVFRKQRDGLKLFAVNAALHVLFNDDYSMTGAV